MNQKSISALGVKFEEASKMIDENITAIIRYFVNETMQLDDSPSQIYGYSINVSIPMTSPTFGAMEDTPTTSSAVGMTVKPNVVNKSDNSFQNAIIVPLYATIFGCCVVGNLLVILTLAQNKRMRTVTNVYLLNLAISDLLLGVFCMPFTLVGQILRNFIFGPLMCKIIPYFQAASVSVAVWTLVAISLERYFAICRPLSSRRWQTRSHAYKMIAMVWFLSLLCNFPLMLVQQLQPVSKASDAMKCREVWPNRSTEQTYVIFLDMALLLLPLLSMGLAYMLIVSKLWRGLKREMKHTSSQRFHTQDLVQASEKQGDPKGANPGSVSFNRSSGVMSTSFSTGSTKTFVKMDRTNLLKQSISNGKLQHLQKNDNGNSNKPKLWFLNGFSKSTKLDKPLKSALKGPQSQLYGPQPVNKVRMAHDSKPISMEFEVRGESNNADKSLQDTNAIGHQLNNRQAIRSNYMDKSIEAKKKVIRMLFVIIIEFFVCWAPIHILNTVYLFSPTFVYSYFNNTGIALIQLMAYISSCCNPITYCFMNYRFRAAFLAIVRSYKCCSCFVMSSEEAESQVFSLKHRNVLQQVPCNSDASNNSNSGVYAGRTSGAQRSELIVLDTEERV